MKTSTATPRTDLYSRVTGRIIAELEQGVRPWLKPWNAVHAEGRITLPLRHNGTPYRGINILLLWGEAIASGYASNIWMTYKQAIELKAHVRKGEHGSTVVYVDRITKTEQDDQGQDVEKAIPFLKAYTVFNVEQIEGLPDHYYVKPEPKAEKMQLIEEAERFFAATGASIRHGGDKAYYSPANDFVMLPVPEAFKDAESYEATKAHELTHWTKHPTRLQRDLGGKRFGDTGYAREELVAELGAAFLCADLGITPVAGARSPLMIGLAGGSMLRSAWLSRRPPPRRRAPPAQARSDDEEGFFVRRAAELETGSTRCRDA